MKKLLTQSEYAVHRNCSRQHISKLVKRGTITLVRGKIDPEQADQQIELASNATHPANREKNEFVSTAFKKAQLKRSTYEMKLNSLKCEIQSGKWVPKNTTKKRAFEEGRIIRDAILRLEDRHAMAFANTKTREKTRMIIIQEIHDICEQARQRASKFFKREATMLANQEGIDHDE